MFNDKKEISFYNELHIGDCLWAITYFNQILALNDFDVVFYINPDYFKQVKELIHPAYIDRVLLKPIIEVDKSKSINTWIGSPENNFCQNIEVSGREIQEMCFRMFLEISSKNGIIFGIKDKSEFIYDHPWICGSNPMLRDIGNPDVLFVNSTPMSTQFSQDENALASLYEELKGKKVFTTKKFGDFPCTLDYGLSLLQIGQIAAKSKIVIGIQTGPFCACVNKEAIKNVKEWYVLVWKNKSEIIFHNIGGRFNICEKADQVVDLLKGKYSKPEISVLMSLYKGEKFLETYLSYFSKFTNLDNCQLVICHNCPSKIELDIIGNFNRKFPGKVKHIIKDSLTNWAESMNECVRNADADLLTIGNVDDLRPPDSLRQQVDFLKNNTGCDVVHGSFWIVGRFGSYEGWRCVRSGYSTGNPELLKEMRIGPFFVWRKSTMERYGYFDEQFNVSADYDFAMRLARRVQIEALDIDLGFYLDEGMGLSTRQGSEEALDRTAIKMRYGIPLNGQEMDISKTRDIKKYNLTDSTYFGKTHRNSITCFLGETSNPIRIAYLMPSLTFGGSEMNFYRLGLEAKKRGYKVGFFATARRSLSYDVSWADEVWTQAGPNTWDAMTEEMVRRLGNYDIIHLTNLTEYQRIYLKERLKDKKFFETWHGIQSMNWAWSGSKSFPADFAVARFCVTDLLVDAVKNKCGDDVFLSLNPIFVPTKTAQLSGRTVSMLGRLDEEKNQMEFVEILAGIPNVKGVLIGDAEPGSAYRSEVEKKAKLLDVDLVVTGYEQDPTQYLLDSDVILHSSSMENQPIAILEAMSFGIPVVARAVGGIPSMISHGEDGFLYTDNNKAKELISLLLSDKEFSKKIGKQARDLVSKKHEVSKCFDFHEGFYKKAFPFNFENTVSVMVSSYNQLGALKIFLESLSFQKQLPIEVIITDDGSTDGTIEWLDSLTQNRYPFEIRYVTRDHGGYRLASIQNLGANKAKGSRLLFTNADVIHCPDSISSHSELKDDTIGAGIIKSINEVGTRKISPKNVSTFNQIVSIAEMNQEGRTNLVWGMYDLNSNSIAVWGGNFSVPSGMFAKVCGFDEGYIGWGGEDANLANRCRDNAGAKISWVGGSVVFHLWHPLKIYSHRQLGSARYNGR
jgi:glycosyltransferase involved in cell wall biosynthesis